jgi:hypothetical protein
MGESFKGACLVSDEGSLWSASDQRLAHSLSSSLTGPALVKFIIQNLGWVKIRPVAGGLEIECRPALVSDLAMISLFYYIGDHPTKTIMLRTVGQEGPCTVLRDRDTFIRLMTTLVTSSRTKFWQGPPFLHRIKPITEAPFRTHADMARHIGSTTPTVEDAFSAFDGIFNNRWSLYEFDPELRRSMVVAVGSGYTPFNPNWSPDGGSRTTSDYADEAFGAWVANTHATAAADNQCICDDLDVVVNFPRLGSTRLRYTRLLMPFLRRAQDRPLILSTSITDSSINLRGHEA